MKIEQDTSIFMVAVCSVLVCGMPFLCTLCQPAAALYSLRGWCVGWRHSMCGLFAYILRMHIACSFGSMVHYIVILNFITWPFLLDALFAGCFAPHDQPNANTWPQSFWTLHHKLRVGRRLSRRVIFPISPDSVIYWHCPIWAAIWAGGYEKIGWFQLSIFILTQRHSSDWERPG